MLESISLPTPKSGGVNAQAYLLPADLINHLQHFLLFDSPPLLQEEVGGSLQVSDRPSHVSLSIVGKPSPEVGPR